MKRRIFIGTVSKSILALSCAPILSSFHPRSTVTRLMPGKNLQGIKLFPANNWWNTPIKNVEIDPLNKIIKEQHQDPNGKLAGITMEYTLPYNIISDVTPTVRIKDRFTGTVNMDPTYLFPVLDDMDVQCPPNWYDEPYDRQCNEKGKDHHIIVIDVVRRKLYEIYKPRKISDKLYECCGSAIFNLDKNEILNDEQTSSDAAGMAILPGLIRYDELVSDQPIQHAIRMTVSTVRANAYIHPATHRTTNGPNGAHAILGSRFRLCEGYDISKLIPHRRKIAQALKDYGAIVVDSGTPFALCGARDPNLANTYHYTKPEDGTVFTFPYGVEDAPNCGFGDPLCNPFTNECINAKNLELLDMKETARLADSVAVHQVF